ncbi:MAG TPA: peptidylprolyl isomerase [Thiopseudomonas sp.]|nr:peptidylprolyl isomerase [Thiopseudomonas sp.]
MLKRILTLCACAIAPSLVFAAADTEAWAVENEQVQVSEAELRIITQAIIQSGQLPADRVSAAHVEKAAKDFMLYKALAEQAQKQGLDKSAAVQKLLEMNQQRVLGSLYLTDYLDNLELPNFAAVAEEEYKLNKKQFERPETVKAQHILIAFEGDEEKSKLKAQEVREQVIAGKKSFAELAKEYSSDSSVSQNGGDLGFFDKKTMVAEFTEAAFSLDIGAVSQPVKTQFGWHIIQVLDSQPPRTIPFAEVKEDLMKQAERKFKLDARGAKLNQTVYSPGLKVNAELIEKIANDLKSK